MKKCLCAMWLLLMMSSLSSCHNDLDSLEGGNIRHQTAKDKHIRKTIRMNFGGDYISESEEPLLRAEDGETYTAINVFRTEKGVDNAQEERYAYGLFKNKEGIEIDVLTGYTYRFEATILIEGNDKVFPINNAYAQPFEYSTDQGGMTGLSYYHSSNLNKFKYTAVEGVEDRRREYFMELASGTTNVDLGNDLGGQPRYAYINYPRVKRYYGNLESFDPGISQSVDIPMGYCTFGLKLEVVSIPSGYVTVKDVTRNGGTQKNPTECLIFSNGLILDNETNKVWECLYSLNDLRAESETFNLEFTWHKGGNVTETFTTDVLVKPRTKKILRLNINGSPNYETKGNISFIMDTEDLADDVQVENKDFTK